MRGFPPPSNLPRGPVPESNLKEFHKRMWWARWFQARSKRLHLPWKWRDERSAARWRKSAQGLRSIPAPKHRNTT